MAGSATEAAVVRADDLEPIGRIEYVPGSPGSGWLTVRDIGMSPRIRGFGYGSEAVRLLEDDAVRHGAATRFRAGVDPRNGLGLYFWLRLGYRPFAGTGGEAGTFWMVRENDDPGPGA